MTGTRSHFGESFDSYVSGFGYDERRHFILGSHAFSVCGPFDDVVVVFAEALGANASRMTVPGQDRLTLLFGLRGDTVMVDSNGQEWRVPANGLGIMYRPSRLSFDLISNAHQGQEVLAVHFGFDALRREPFRSGLARIHPGISDSIDREGCLLGTLGMTPDVRALALDVVAASRASDLGPMEAPIRTLRLLDALGRLAAASPGDIDWLVPRGGMLEKMFLARRMIEQRLSEPLTLAMLAEALSISEARLKTGFRAAFGVPPMAYLARMRVERAKLLLQGSDTPVGQIAWSVGYAHQCNFAVAFRRATGMSPKAYRRSCTG